MELVSLIGRKAWNLVSDKSEGRRDSKLIARMMFLQLAVPDRSPEFSSRDERSHAPCFIARSQNAISVDRKSFIIHNK